MASKRYSRTTYYKQFTFSIDFDINHETKKLYIERYDDLSLMAQVLVLNELRKPEPFKDVVTHKLKPRKYSEASFEKESVKLLQLIRNLCAGGRKECPIHWLWLYKYRVGFSDDDAKLIEQCLYNLLETEQIEVTNMSHSLSSDKEMLMVRPKMYVKAYNQKYELINANATIRTFKKGIKK